uniref:hypothetical protein n=1 Tax=Acetatifactor sp. TaxID=1872090 RepID=UPI004057AF05
MLIITELIPSKDVQEHLKEEIQDRLSYDESCLSRFYKNDGTCIYELRVYDPEDRDAREQGYYASAEIAVACGKKFQENFSVHKVRLVTEEKESEDCCSDCIATVCFCNQGQVQGYYSSEVEWTAKKPELDRERFENAYIEIPHPFRNGDFVRAKNNDWLEDEVCIVECSNDEVDEKYGLLCCAQALMSGKGGLSDLQFLCDEYCGKQKNRRGGWQMKFLQIYRKKRLCM